MPIYEYLCTTCNRIYSFMAKNIEETKTKQPTCPKCGSANLRKQISRFSVGTAPTNSDADKTPSDLAGDEPFDDPRVERDMMKLMDQAENIDDNDPKQLGQLMRKMSEITGETLDPEMEEAVRRLENGEDPEKVEEEMGDIFGDEQDTTGGAAPPTYDDGLYSL